jgi:hypothetical protein
VSFRCGALYLSLRASSTGGNLGRISTSVSDLSVEADEDTGDEGGDSDTGTGPDAGGAAKP